ncbi:MAG: hypothetical protein ACKVS5_11600 [Parvularculaceae bacterium]
MVRSVFAVIAGIFAGAILVFVIERAGHAFFPAPPGFDPTAPGAIASLPFQSKFSVLIAWFAGALGGGIVAALASRRWAPTAWIVAATILLLAGTSLASIDHPPWMALGSIPATALGGVLAIKLTRGRYGAPPAAAKATGF